MEKKPTFRNGQKVIAVEAVPGSKFKNGNVYTVRRCRWLMNPTNNTGPYCYIGVNGHIGNYYRTAIFAPLNERFKPGIFNYREKETLVECLQDDYDLKVHGADDVTIFGSTKRGRFHVKTESGTIIVHFNWNQFVRFLWSKGLREKQGNLADFFNFLLYRMECKMRSAGKLWWQQVIHHEIEFNG